MSFFFPACQVFSVDILLFRWYTQKKEPLMKSARAGGRRFWLSRKFWKRRNTLCIPRFQNCTD